MKDSMMVVARLVWYWMTPRWLAMRLAILIPLLLLHHWHLISLGTVLIITIPLLLGDVWWTGKELKRALHRFIEWERCLESAKEAALASVKEMHDECFRKNEEEWNEEDWEKFKKENELLKTLTDEAKELDQDATSEFLSETLDGSFDSLSNGLNEIINAAKQKQAATQTEYERDKTGQKN